MSVYQIIDETSTHLAGKVRLPWPPLGLFFLTVLFAPVGAVMFAFNWPRLGFPERRWLALGAGVLALVLPSLIAAIAVWMKWPTDRSTWRPIVSFVSLGIAYYFLLAQKPHYDAHIARGGLKASTLWLWLLALVTIALQVALIFVRR